MRRKRGVILLEVLLALAIVAIAGSSFLVLAADNLTAVRRARESDGVHASASDYLSVVTLWPIEDLDRRLGLRRQGPWFLHIDRESPRVYAITLLDSARTPLLQTAVFRPDGVQ